MSADFDKLLRNFFLANSMESTFKPRRININSFEIHVLFQVLIMDFFSWKNSMCKVDINDFRS